jgi:hypothetical protein
LGSGSSPQAATSNQTRYIILRDDDTNALTPPECLERLYRPFLARGLPVNLATIPAVRTDAKRPDGQPEGFLSARAAMEPLNRAADSPSPPPGERAGVRGQAVRDAPVLPLTASPGLIEYLRANQGFHLVQHGYHHEPFEFDRADRSEIHRRIEAGRHEFEAAGFPAPETFVAPHDKFSRTSYSLLASQFRVISTGWFELRRLPYVWWPKYAFVKALKRPHWRVNGTLLLSHPGCLLSYHRPYDTMLDTIKSRIQRQQLTVLVTHCWEYFPNGQPDELFISVLHSLADYLASAPDLKVITFSDSAQIFG